MIYFKFVKYTINVSALQNKYTKIFFKSHWHQKVMPTCRSVNSEIRIPHGYFLPKCHVVSVCVNSFHRVN